MCRPEPRLDDLLRDPIIRLMMASDAVEEGDIRRLARSVTAAARSPRAASRSDGAATSAR